MINSKVETGEVYRHVTGRDYLVLNVAVRNDQESETLAVVHQGLHDGRLWVRDISNFLGTHPSGKPRFTKISDPQPVAVPDISYTRIAQLEELCAEAYQVIGSLAECAGMFETRAVEKALDNLSQLKMVHNDVLPFPVPAPQPVAVPDELPEQAPDAIMDLYFHTWCSDDAEYFSDGWNACRAAMLERKK